MIIQQGKTNWKYILIVLVLAVIVGGGILGWIKKPEVPLAELPEIEKPEKVVEKEIVEDELKKEVINKIAYEVIPSGYELPKPYKGGYDFITLEDLNGDNKLEAIFGATIDIECPEGYTVVVTLIDDKLNYEKIAGFDFDRRCGFSLVYPNALSTFDVDNDGIKEILSSLPVSAVYSNYTILDVDWPNKKMDWLKVRNQEGEIISIPILSRGASVRHSANFDIKDTNGNGLLEIIYRECEYLSEAPKDSICKTNVYEWNGEVVSYNEELSLSLSDYDFSEAILE